MSGPAEVRVLDGRLDVERLAGYPMFYFDLAPVLEHCRGTLSRHPERLRLMCEQTVGRLAPNELILFKVDGFFLIAQSCAGAAAKACANSVNLGLLRLLFGSESLAPDRLSCLFRAAAADEIAAFAVTKRCAQKIGEASDKGARAVDEPLRRSDDPSDRCIVGAMAECAGLTLELMSACDLRRNVASTFFSRPCALSRAAG